MGGLKTCFHTMESGFQARKNMFPLYGSVFSAGEKADERGARLQS